MANTLHQLKRATEIVERYRARGNLFPRELRDCGRGDPASQQEYRDACKVKTWKYSLQGKNIYNCSDEIRDYLDENMPGWCDRVYSHQGQSSQVQMQKAVQIVERYRERGHILPRRLKDPTKAQETKDAINISTWKSSLKGYNRVTCSSELCTYLDENMPGWRQDHHKSKPRSAKGKEKAARALLAGTTACELNKLERSSEQLMPIARGIVDRYLANNRQYPSLKLTCRQDPSRAQEYSDAKKLHSWKSHTDKSLAPDVFAYLDKHMPLWKNSHVTPSNKNVLVSKAREIFRRCTMRGGVFPRLAPAYPEDPAGILEHKDALKLREWKISFATKPHLFCSVLRTYLDEKLPAWRAIDYFTPLPYEVKGGGAAKRKSGALHHYSPRDDSTTGRDRDSTSISTSCGTDDEQSSESGFEYELSLEGPAAKGGAAKRQKLALSPADKEEEFAGITALMQLSGGGSGSGGGVGGGGGSAVSASGSPSMAESHSFADAPTVHSCSSAAASISHPQAQWAQPRFQPYSQPQGHGQLQDQHQHHPQQHHQYHQHHQQQHHQHHGQLQHHQSQGHSEQHHGIIAAPSNMLFLPTMPSSFSTYGNGGAKHQASNSLYSKEKSNMELYLSSLACR